MDDLTNLTSQHMVNIIEKLLNKINTLENRISQLEDNMNININKPKVYMPPVNDFSHIDLKEQCYY